MVMLGCILAMVSGIGSTTFLRILNHQRTQAVIWLLNHNADREIKDIQGRTAEDLIEETL